MISCSKSYMMGVAYLIGLESLGEEIAGCVVTFDIAVDHPSFAEDIGQSIVYV